MFEQIFQNISLSFYFYFAQDPERQVVKDAFGFQTTSDTLIQIDRHISHNA